jgi:peptidoglycan/LPS O-acetylase OafA/YrhL
MTTKFQSLEGIRGLACLMVVFSHLSLTFFPYIHNFSNEIIPQLFNTQQLIYDLPLGFLYSGTSAVFVFFVMSGYVLTHAIISKNKLKSVVIKSSIKRYPRLMFPAISSCVFAFLCFEYLNFDRSNLSDWIQSYGSGIYSINGAIYNGALDIFFFSGRSSYNYVLWTMQVELIGSIMIFLLCLLKAKHSKLLIGSSIIILSAILVLTRLVNVNLGLGIIAFVVGQWFYLYGKDIDIKTSMILIFSGLYLAGAHEGSTSYSLISNVLGSYTYKIGTFLSGFLIVYAIIFNSNFNRYMSNKFFVYLGRLSFSVYLSHLLVIFTVGVYSFNLFYELTLTYNLSALISSFLTILTTYILANLFHKYIDLNGIKLSSGISNYFSKYLIKGSK